LKQAETPPYTEAEVLILLDGSNKDDPRRGSSFLLQLQFCRRIQHHPELWTLHEKFLLDEARRLGVTRPVDERGQPALYYGESCAALKQDNLERTQRRLRGDLDGNEPDLETLTQKWHRYKRERQDDGAA
jgi:hypothetical protein